MSTLAEWWVVLTSKSFRYCMFLFNSDRKCVGHAIHSWQETIDKKKFMKWDDFILCISDNWEEEVGKLKKTLHVKLLSKFLDALLNINPRQTLLYSYTKPLIQYQKYLNFLYIFLSNISSCPYLWFHYINIIINIIIIIIQLDHFIFKCVWMCGWCNG